MRESLPAKDGDTMDSELGKAIKDAGKAIDRALTKTFIGPPEPHSEPREPKLKARPMEKPKPRKVKTKSKRQIAAEHAALMRQIRAQPIMGHGTPRITTPRRSIR